MGWVGWGGSPSPNPAWRKAGTSNFLPMTSDSLGPSCTMKAAQ
jgi:hypothetical protein